MGNIGVNGQVSFISLSLVFINEGQQEVEPKQWWFSYQEVLLKNNVRSKSASFSSRIASFFVKSWSESDKIKHQKAERLVCLSVGKQCFTVSSSHQAVKSIWYLAYVQMPARFSEETEAKKKQVFFFSVTSFFCLHALDLNHPSCFCLGSVQSHLSWFPQSHDLHD